ncbi:flagellar hook-length control protein FliK [Aeromonas tecta]|uniref:flagellar hook-length control protein FliK n=1 Tax=Aeromonas tecta TaxID=324617 RepID=UPI00068204D1|nr:flagellar hook-length control protein FliK [Aeromonas tecta]
MIQTQLIKATATQTTSADPRLSSGATLGVGEGAELPSLDEVKAAFADAMAKAQRTDNGPSASQGDDEPSPVAGADAKSLATALDEPSAEQDSAAKRQAGESGLPPADFLQQLQASLRQDVTLVAPPAVSWAQSPAAITDGNSLPPESQPIGLTDASKQAPAPAPGAAGREAAAQQALLQQMGEGISTEAPAHPDKATGVSEPGKGAQAISAPVTPVSVDALPVSQPEEEAIAADKPLDPKSASSKPTAPPLSGEERAALLAKVVASAQTALPQSAAAQLSDNPQQQITSEPASNGALTSAPHTAQASAAKAFGEGLVRMESGVNGGVDASTEAATVSEDGSEPRPAAQEPASKPAQAAGASKPDAGATSNATPVAADPAPVIAAPQQILASHESQGPQASLTALSAGIEQMEAEPAVAVKVAAGQDLPEVKSRQTEFGNNLVSEAKVAEQTEASPSAAHAQQPIQGTESRPAAELAARREPQSLPHLRLATPEAPEQLHQKVNLMLADKLQQAEIQLDPLGLGKMKIQIQMGADSQANVHFVVQHGQTREMLEQAMPRLRDMLAGQGIQLGQTQVQQQGQQSQQSQGQSTFTGQDQRGQQGSGSFAGNGQGEGEGTTRTMSLLVESANDAGIDFYA